MNTKHLFLSLVTIIVIVLSSCSETTPANNTGPLLMYPYAIHNSIVMNKKCSDTKPYTFIMQVYNYKDSAFHTYSIPACYYNDFKAKDSIK